MTKPTEPPATPATPKPAAANGAVTMAVLPPPFVVPLYMARARGRDVSDDPDHDYLANTLSLATVVTLVLITIVGVVYAT